jgi:RNA polymerase sigma factor (sigma-70 family)
MTPEPWQGQLRAGNPVRAWDLFLDRYRRLIFAAIRQYSTDHDDVMDVFSVVCQGLRAKDLARLRSFVDASDRPARFSTWLVVVVHNLVIDWHRARVGRKRRSQAAESLTATQERIYEYVFYRSLSHLEAYEQLSTLDQIDISFGDFLRELRETYRVLGMHRSSIDVRRTPTVSLDSAGITEISDRVVEELRPDSIRYLNERLGELRPDDRAAVQLFVGEGLAAAEVARIVGWPSAKTVYNRVPRALAALRAEFVRRGLGPGDL